MGFGVECVCRHHNFHLPLLLLLLMVMLLWNHLKMSLFATVFIQLFNDSLFCPYFVPESNKVLILSTLSHSQTVPYRFGYPKSFFFYFFSFVLAKSPTSYPNKTVIYYYYDCIYLYFSNVEFSHMHCVNLRWRLCINIIVEPKKNQQDTKKYETNYICIMFCYCRKCAAFIRRCVFPTVIFY